MGAPMLPPANVIDTASGKYLLLATRDLISTKLYQTGVWEPFTTHIAKLFLAARPSNGIVIDAGANLGAFAVSLGQALAADMTMHCFEAQRIVFYQLCANVVLNRFANVHPYNIALGSAADWIDVPVPDYANDQNVGGVSLSAEVRGLRNELATDKIGSASEKVEMRTLDSFGFTEVRLLKIDVEGMEWDVLQGAKETLAHSAYPPMLLEIWNKDKRPAFTGHVERLLGYITGLGYSYQVLGDLCIAQYRGRPTLKVTVDMEKGSVAFAWEDAA